MGKHKMGRLPVKRKKEEQRVAVNIRVTRAEKFALEALAKRFTGGNLSQWIKLSGVKFRPSH
jgi:hypothetical protein